MAQVRNAYFSSPDCSVITGEWLHDDYGWIPHTAIRGESEIMDAVFGAFLSLPPVPYVEPTPDNGELADAARYKRDALMRDTDWMVLADSPLSESDREKVLICRQELRDVTEQPGFPVDIAWPVLEIDHARR